MYLNLAYKLLPHPFAYELIWDHERWCELKLEVLDENLNLVKTIFHFESDICVLLNWLLINEEFIRNEIAPKELENDFSLAKGVYDFYNNDDDDDDDNDDYDDIYFDIYNRIYHYRARHEINLALMGVDVNKVKIELLLGLHNNNMTISYYKENESWNYEIDAEKFFSDIKNISDEVACPPYDW